MRFNIVTIFPEFFAGPLDHGILRRAQEANLIEVRIQNLREFTKDRHKTVDDRPFGGGEGMVLKPEPLFEAVEALLGHSAGDAKSSVALDSRAAIVLLSASGKRFTQETARRYAQLERVILLCGRYEGVDERVAQHLATEEVSIGEFVLSGGELPAAMIIDAVTRLLPGALGNEASSQNESFASRAGGEEPVVAGNGRRTPPVFPCTQPVVNKAATFPCSPPGVNLHPVLDFPHYTRPADFRGWRVPEVLISGHHAEVAKWRRAAALEKTERNRPDLLAGQY